MYEKCAKCNGKREFVKEKGSKEITLKLSEFQLCLVLHCCLFDQLLNARNLLCNETKLIYNKNMFYTLAALSVTGD